MLPDIYTKPHHCYSFLKIPQLKNLPLPMYIYQKSHNFSLEILRRRKIVDKENTRKKKKKTFPYIILKTKQKKPFPTLQLKKSPPLRNKTPFTRPNFHAPWISNGASLKIIIFRYSQCTGGGLEKNTLY